jgi:hypothetical protein
MKTFKEYITEAKVEKLYPDGKMLRTLQSPNAQEIMKFTKNSKDTASRFVINEKGVMWLWDAYNSYHDVVASDLSDNGMLGKSYDVVNGSITYDDTTDEWTVFIDRIDGKAFDNKVKSLKDLKKIMKKNQEDFEDDWTVG